MKKLLLKGFAFTTLGFLILLLLRLAYGYITYPDNVSSDDSRTDRWIEVSNSKNYASKKLVLQKSGSRHMATVDQKYEKIGTISTKTSNFDKDQKELKETIQRNNILVQYEQRSGLKGYRVLKMALGVIPSKFDLVIKEVKTIGNLKSIQINKSDKTNEYKSLDAKKKSFVKTRDALIALKAQGGKIEELLKLEERILDIENEIQTFGVSLGEFDEENEFCTIKYTLAESRANPPIPIGHRVKVAFEWTVTYYFKIVIFCFFGSILFLAVITILNKFRWLRQQIANAIEIGKLFIEKEK